MAIRLLLVCSVFVVPTVLTSRSLAQAPDRPATPRLDADGQPLPPGALVRIGSTRFRHKQPVSYLGFAGDRYKLLALSGGEIRLWNLDTGKALWRKLTPAVGDARFERRYFGRTAELVLSQDGRTVAWWVGDQLKFHDATTGKEIASVAQKKLAEDLKADASELRDAEFQLSADGQFVVVSDSAELFRKGRGQGRKVGVWRADTGALVRVIDMGEKKSLVALALAGDGQSLATVEESAGKDEKESRQTVRLWNLATGKEVKSFSSPVERPSHLRFLPGGKALVALDRGGESVHLVDTATGKEQRRFLSRGELQRVLMSADGKRLAAVTHDSVWVWETAAGKELLRVPAVTVDRGELAAALSADGKRLAVAVGVSFRLWDVDTGKAVRMDEGHVDGVASLAFAPRGGQLLTAAPHGALLLWEAKSGRLVRSFAFAPAGVPEGGAAQLHQCTVEDEHHSGGVHAGRQDGPGPGTGRGAAALGRGHEQGAAVGGGVAEVPDLLRHRAGRQACRRGRPRRNAAAAGGDRQGDAAVPRGHRAGEGRAGARRLPVHHHGVLTGRQAAVRHPAERGTGQAGAGRGHGLDVSRFRGVHRPAAPPR